MIGAGCRQKAHIVVNDSYTKSNSMMVKFILENRFSRARDEDRQGDSKMSRKAVIASIFSLLLAAAVAGPAQGRDRHYPDRYGPGAGHGDCCRGPSCGWWGYVPGYNHSYGYGYGYGSGWWGYGPDRSTFGSTLSRGEAKKLVQWIIRFNPDLEVGDVTETEDGYEVTIVTRKGNRLVHTLMVERDTACVFPVYRE
jgi:hypothetical protein